METRHLGCPNCGAPLDLPIGEVEALCEYCGSRLKFIPEDNELEVVRTREEMKHRERVEVEKQILRNRLQQEEMDRWRETAAKVAIAAVPIVGRTAGRAAFNSALKGGGGCGGCGCLVLIAVLLGVGALFGL
jgi:uncharacterized Zn finger protein (UPF0148 family)